ncbi:MAG: hypothetical protein JRJ62_00255 [Deltaproteobacteria bacterium]|nr:hypothetical protein [Deltaproteobacteria bacterium]
MKTTLVARIRTNEFEAKEVNGKFYAWVPRAHAWQRVAKTKIFKVEVK